MSWQAVFFDFDGVIVDSAHIKTEAFAAMFRQYGNEIEQAVVAYHLEHQGVSRFDKFRYFLENLLHEPVDDTKLTDLGNDFSRRVVEAIIQAPFVAGAMEALVELKSQGTPAYVISGTPEDEMRYIVQRKGISHLFTGVYGTPAKKAEILGRILSQEDYLPSDCLFIGDAVTDYHAAHEKGLCFLGIVADDQEMPFPDGTWISSSVVLKRMHK